MTVLCVMRVYTLASYGERTRICRKAVVLRTVIVCAQLSRITRSHAYIGDDYTRENNVLYTQITCVTSYLLLLLLLANRRNIVLYKLYN